MTGSAQAKRKSLGPLLLISSLLTGILFPARSAPAFSNIQIGTTSSENLTFALYNTTTTSGSMHWSGSGNTGMLTDAGSSYFPALTTVNGTAQTSSWSDLGAFTETTSASVPPLPTSFGSATVSGSASTNLGENGSALANTIGVSFNGGTYLQTAATMGSNTAGVSYTTLHADFVNSTSSGGPGHSPGTYTGTAGAVISASGVLNTSSSSPSFVELANAGTITINGVSSSYWVIAGWAWNGSTVQSFQAGDGTLTLTNPTASNGDFSITDNYSLGSVTVPEGASFSVNSQLTLVSDPGSFIQLSDLSDVPGQMPTLGVLLGSSVPEPSAWIQLGTAMALLIVLWGRCRYGRISLNVPSLPGVSAVLLAGLTSLLGMGATATAEASTITINDLSPPPSASSSGFSSSTITTNSMDQTATFDGTYLSTGGFPAPGESATYWVVFQAPDGTQTDATELMITGLTPTPTENTSVYVFFEGLVTSQIPSGPGNYFIPEPGGFFDVAAYLISQGAPDVPGDLSVLIASVPEPTSIVSGGIGLLLAGLWGVCQRSRQV